MIRILYLFIVTYLLSFKIYAYDITVNENCLVSINVHDAEITEVLRELSKKANLTIELDPHVKGKISLNYQNISLERLLDVICKNKALVYEYLQDKKQYRVFSVKVASSKSFHERPLFREQELLVRFKNDVSWEEIQQLHKKIGAEVLDEIKALKLHRVKLPTKSSLDDAIKQYMDSGIVINAEKHAIRHLKKIVPNDPYFERQWGLQRANFPSIWEITNGSNEVKVAIIDTGIDYTHPDLKENIWINNAEAYGLPNIDDDGNGYIDDIYGWDFGDNDPYPLDHDGHGTSVSGIIGAKANNNIGIAGVCWNIKLIPLKVISDYSNDISVMDIIKAIHYAIEKGANIINCSFGGEASSEEERNAFLDLRNAGVLAVCAAGNEQLDNDSNPVYPASYNLENIISVAAIDSTDHLANFSNYGKNSVHVAAPGVNILSTSLNSSYSTCSGSSFAAAFVSGLASLILSKKPELHFSTIKSLITDYVQKSSYLEEKILSKGIIDASQAICKGIIQWGDVNGDGKTDLIDVISVLQIVNGQHPTILYPCVPISIDVNGDRKLGIEEAVYLLKHVTQTSVNK